MLIRFGGFFVYQEMTDDTQQHCKWCVKHLQLDDQIHVVHLEMQSWMMIQFNVKHKANVTWKLHFSIQEKSSYKHILLGLFGCGWAECKCYLSLMSNHFDVNCDWWKLFIIVFRRKKKSEFKSFASLWYIQDDDAFSVTCM